VSWVPHEAAGHAGQEDQRVRSRAAAAWGLAVPRPR
jgi:hypothetical protein